MLRLVTFLLVSAAGASGQQTFSCEMMPTVPPLLRFESRAERIADILLTCNGFATSGLARPITVNLSAPIATPLAGVTMSVGDPAVTYTPTLTATNALTFSNVALSGVTPFSIRIAGIRVAHQFLSSALSVEPLSLKALVSAQEISIRGPEVVVGYIVPSLQFQLLNAAGVSAETLLLSPSATALTHTVVYRETQVNGFRLRASEPGATQSTRLVAQFSNLPPGAAVSVSAVSLSGPSARLTSTETGAYSPSPLVPAYVPLTITNNTATAVWEVLTADPAALETVTFGIIAAGSATAAVVTGRHGPFDATSLPRFEASPQTPAACNPTCVQVPKALSYTHRFGDPRPGPVPFPIAFVGPAVPTTIGSFTEGWFSVSNGMAQWSPEFLAPGQYTGIVTVQPGNQAVYLTLTVLPPVDRFSAPAWCELARPVPAVLRVEGYTEAVTPIELNCTGRPNSSVNTQLLLRVNAPVTSAGANVGSFPPQVEALLFSSDPTTGMVGPGSPGYRVDPSTIQFPLTMNIPSSGRLTITIVNVRVNANAIGLSVSPTIPATVEVAVSTVSGFPAISNSKVSVGVTGPALRYSGPTALPVVPVISTEAPLLATTEISFLELQPNAFRRRNVATTFASYLLADQSDPFNNFFTETLVFDSTRGQQGLATNGTRLRVVFSGVPAGVEVFVTGVKLPSSSGSVEAKRIWEWTPEVSGPYVVRDSTTSMVVNGVSVPAAPVSIEGGSGVAAWEILGSNPFSLEDIRFGVAARVVGGAANLSVTMGRGSIAPLRPVGPGSAIPTFSDLTPTAVDRCRGLDCILLPASLVVRKSLTGAITQSAPFTASTNGGSARYVATSNVPWLILANPVGYAPATLGIAISSAAQSFAPGLYPAIITLNGVDTPVTYSVEGGSPASVDDTPPVFVSGSGALFQFDFSHAGGFGQLDVVNALINTALEGANACYVAFSRPLNVLYLVNDAGVSAGLSAPLSLGSGDSVSNGQCTVFGTGSAVIATGNMLRLRLNIGFQTAFSGNRVVYLAARGVSGENSGWQTKGGVIVPGGPLINPQVSAAQPSTGTTLAESINFNYSSTAPLETVWGLINGAVDARQACYFAYHVPSGSIFLVPDNGDGAQATTMPLAGSGTVENSQCRLAATGSSALRTGNNLSLTLRINFKPGLLGSRGIWGAAKTLDSAPASPWRIIGAWQVPLF